MIKDAGFYIFVGFGIAAIFAGAIFRHLHNMGRIHYECDICGQMWDAEGMKSHRVECHEAMIDRLQVIGALPPGELDRSIHPAAHFTEEVKARMSDSNVYDAYFLRRMREESNRKLPRLSDSVEFME